MGNSWLCGSFYQNAEPPPPPPLSPGPTPAQLSDHPLKSGLQASRYFLLLLSASGLVTVQFREVVWGGVILPPRDTGVYTVCKIWFSCNQAVLFLYHVTYSTVFHLKITNYLKFVYHFMSYVPL